MQYTENYEMKKPETSDFYDVEDFNENADIVDSKLKELETAKDNMNQAMSELKKYVSDGKKAVASAITELGVATQTDAAFEEMVESINNLEISMRRVKNQIFANLNGHNEENIDMPDATIEKPTLSWNGAQVTAITKVSKEGYVDTDDFVSAVTSITTQKETMITPKTSVQTVEASGNRVYFSGDMKVDSLGGNANAGDVLSEKIFSSDTSGRAVSGTMPNNGAVSKALNCSVAYTIPAGYHNGSGLVTANSLASQTDGTASAADIITGKTAWVTGKKLTGTMNRLADYRYIPNQTLQIRNRTSYTDGTGTTQNCNITRFLTVFEGCTGYISGTNHEHMILLSRLGNASAHQVVKGATFTSGNCSSVATEGTFEVTTVSHVYSWGNHFYMPLYMRIGALDYSGHDTTAFTQTSGSGSVSMSQGTGYIDITVSSGYGCYVIKKGITLTAGITYTLAMRTVEYSGSGNHYVFLSNTSNAASPAASMYSLQYGACAGDNNYHNYTATITATTTQVVYPVVYCTSTQKFSLCSLSIWRHL